MKPVARASPARPRKVTALLDLSEHALEENNVRTGFVDETQYHALAEKQ